MLFWWCCSCVVRHQEHIAVNASATLNTGRCSAPWQSCRFADREDSQNLANANYSNLPLIWQAAVKDAQRRNAINGGDPPKARRRPFMAASRILEGRLPDQQPQVLRIFGGQSQPATEQRGISGQSPWLVRVGSLFGIMQPEWSPTIWGENALRNLSR